MRKQKYSQRKKISAPVVALLLGGLLLAVAAFVIFQGNNQGSDTGGAPRLAVDREKIDWGTVKDYTKKTFTFTVTNTGTGTLRFKEKPYVQVVEGCCPPTLTVSSMVLKPGESATVTSAVFMMHPGMDGKHNYAVHLLTNDATQPDKVVNVISDWVP
jgi:hypothetical protein